MVEHNAIARGRLLGNREAGRAMERLTQLMEERQSMHVRQMKAERLAWEERERKEKAAEVEYERKVGELTESLRHRQREAEREYRQSLQWFDTRIEEINERVADLLQALGQLAGVEDALE